MTITFTTTYPDTLKPETVAVLEELCGQNGEGGAYYLEDALVFIDEYSEAAFIEYYEEYVELGEQYTFPAVEAFISEHGFGRMEFFTDAYIGEFYSPSDMAEDYLSYESQDADSRLCIDWRETADWLLAHEVDRVGDYYFRSSF